MIIFILKIMHIKGERAFYSINHSRFDLQVSILRKVLKGPNLLDDNVSRAFLRTITYLIGSYREAFKSVKQYKSRVIYEWLSCPNFGTFLRCRFENGQIVFDNETFISSRGSSMKPFLQKLVSAQTFQQVV